MHLLTTLAKYPNRSIVEILVEPIMKIWVIYYKVVYPDCSLFFIFILYQSQYYISKWVLTYETFSWNDIICHWWSGFCCFNNSDVYPGDQGFHTMGYPCPKKTGWNQEEKKNVRTSFWLWNFTISLLYLLCI